MGTEKKDYDGHIAIDLGHQTLERRTGDINIRVFTSEDSSYIPLTQVRRLMMRRNTRELLREHPETTPAFSVEELAKVKQSYKNIADKHGKIIAEIIVEGKLKMSLFINTGGGEMSIVQDVNCMASLITERGGRIESYVPYKAYSAGAYAFAVAPNRYTTTESSFMWHPPYHLDSDGNPDFTNRAEGMAKIRSFFEKESYPWALPMIRDRIYEAGSDPNNLSTDVRFTGDELNESGLVTEIFPDVSSLAKKYYQGCSSISEKIFGSFYFNFAKFEDWFLARAEKKMLSKL